MNVISCDYTGRCPYREGTICMLPIDYWCNQEYHQYERIPLDQMMMEDRNVDKLYQLDHAGNSAIRLRRV